MRYHVTVAGREYEVDLAGDAVRVDGELLTCDLAAVPGTTVRHLLAAGRSWLLDAVRGDVPGAWRIQVEGLQLDVAVEDERTREIRSRLAVPEAARGPRPVRAPMPGLVVRLEVEPGQRVQPGQPVVVVEAMKMQNELKAEAAGIVAHIRVAVGEAVEKGTVLIEFDASAGEEP
jgi:biotin carboxyl carrier protein